MLSPRQTFEDNLRPAELLLRLYRLLDCDDHILTEGDLVTALRRVVQASATEDLMVVYNQIFLGLVRERADMPRITLRRATLANLLRQSIVISCTALDTFLPSLWRAYLPTVIRAVGRAFVPVGDNAVNDFFKDLTFSLDETMRLMNDPNAADYISQKILNLTNFKYLSTRKGIHVTGRLLGLGNPWNQVMAHLQLDVEKKELMDTLERTVTRRNDIVHRADRSQDHPDGPQQDITFATAMQSVDTIKHICLALDEIIAEQMKVYAALIEANTPNG